MVHEVIHEGAIVGYHEHAPFEIFQHFLQRLDGVEVEVVGGLVEDQKVGAQREHREKLQSALFPAAQLPDRGHLLRPAEVEPLEEFVRGDVRVPAETSHRALRLRLDLANVLNHLEIFVAEIRDLRVVPELDRLAHGHPPLVQRNLAHDGLQEGGLPRAVGSHESDLLALAERVREPVHDSLLPE